MLLVTLLIHKSMERASEQFVFVPKCFPSDALDFIWLRDLWDSLQWFMTCRMFDHKMFGKHSVLSCIQHDLKILFLIVDAINFGGAFPVRM